MNPATSDTGTRVLPALRLKPAQTRTGKLRACWKALDGSPWLPAQVGDLSRDGLRLVLGRAVQAGALLVLDLPSANGAACYSRAVSVKAVITLPGGRWEARAHFYTPLSAMEFQGLTGTVGAG